MKLIGFLGAVMAFFSLAYALRKHEETDSTLVACFWALLVIAMFPIMMVCLFWFLFY